MATLDEEVLQLTDLFENNAAQKIADSLKFSPESLSALYAMAFELYRNGKYEDAKCFFRILTLSNSFERKYWMGLGASCQMLKSYSEAIECYSAAAIQDSTDPYVHWHAADCYFHSGNLPKAKEALESALVTAKEDETYKMLIPQLELISETWLNIPNGASHD